MTHDLKWSLEDLADAEYADAPPSTIDIAKARHDGRRKLVTGRLAPVGAGIAVVAVCGLAVSGIAGGGGATGAAQTPASGNTTSQNAQAVKAVTGSSFTTGTDPLMTRASYTWIPDGWTAGTRDGGPDYGDHNAIQGPGNPAAKDNPAPFVNLQVTATEQSLIDGSTTESASVPGSKKAYFVHMPHRVGFDPSDLALVWQTSSGVWVNLYSTHLGGGADAAKTTLTKIAEGLVVEDKPVALPFHVEGLPHSLTPHQTELNVPALNGTGTGWDVQLQLSNGEKNAFLVSVTPAGQPTHPASGQPSEKPPSFTPSTKTRPDQECKDENGLHICVTDFGNDSATTAKDLLDRITSLGADQANWTTHVLN